MKQRVGIPDIGPMIGILLLAVAAGVGSGLVFAPEVMVPSTVEAAALLLVTAMGLRLERDPIVRSWVWKLAAGALLLRGLALVFVHGPLDPYFFAPDALSYEMMGQELRDFWMRGASYPSSLVGEWQVAYPYLNGFFYLFLDDVAVAGAVLNTFFGVWTVILTFYLGRELLGEQAGKLASGMVAIFPSMLLWSVINIRDAIATFLVVFIIITAVRLYRRPAPHWLALLAGGLLVMSTFRDYVAILLLTGLAVGFAAASRPHRLGSTFFLGVLFSMLTMLMMSRLNLFGVASLESPIQTMAGLRESMQFDATSSYGQGYQTDTLGGAIRFLPLGLVYLLFAPFPWRIESALQLTSLPEVVLWYLLFPLCAVGIRYAVQKGAPQNLIVVGAMAVVVSCYALVEGNFGTAYRHRAQVMPLFFLFGAAGILILKHRWEEGKKPRSGRISRTVARSRE